MKTRKFIINLLLCLCIVVTFFAIGCGCTQSQPNSSSNDDIPTEEGLLFAFDDMDDLYKVKFVNGGYETVQSLDVNEKEEYVSQGSGSLQVNYHKGEKPKIMIHKENLLMPDLDFLSLKTISVDIFNPQRRDVNITISLIKSGKSVICSQTAVADGQVWSTIEFPINAVVMNYSAESVIGVMLEFDVAIEASYYVDNMRVELGNVISEEDKAYTTEIEKLTQDINELPAKLTLSDESKLMELVNRYEAIPSEYRGAVSNYDVLNNAVLNYISVAMEAEKTEDSQPAFYYDKFFGLYQIQRSNTYNTDVTYSYSTEKKYNDEAGSLKISMDGSEWTSLWMISSANFKSYDYVTFAIYNDSDYDVVMWVTWRQRFIALKNQWTEISLPATNWSGGSGVDELDFTSYVDDKHEAAGAPNKGDLYFSRITLFSLQGLDGYRQELLPPTSYAVTDNATATVSGKFANVSVAETDEVVLQLQKPTGKEKINVSQVAYMNVIVPEATTLTALDVNGKAVKVISLTKGRNCVELVQSVYDQTVAFSFMGMNGKNYQFGTTYVCKTRQKNVAKLFIQDDALPLASNMQFEDIIDVLDYINTYTLVDATTRQALKIDYPTLHEEIQAKVETVGECLQSYAAQISTLDELIELAEAYKEYLTISIFSNIQMVNEAIVNTTDSYIEQLPPVSQIGSTVSAELAEQVVALKKVFNALSINQIKALRNADTWETFTEEYNKIPYMAFDYSNEEYKQYFALGSEVGDIINSVYGTTKGSISIVENATYGKVMQVDFEQAGDPTTQISFRLSGREAWEQKLLGYDKIIFYVYNPLPTETGAYLRIATGDWGVSSSFVGATGANYALTYGWNKVEMVVGEFTKLPENGGQLYFFFANKVNKKFDTTEETILISNFYGIVEAGRNNLNSLVVENIQSLILSITDTTSAEEISEIKAAYNALVESDKAYVSSEAKERLLTAEERIASALNAEIDNLANVESLENEAIELKIDALEKTYQNLSDEAKLTVNYAKLLAYKQSYFEKVFQDLPNVAEAEYEEILSAVENVERVYNKYIAENDSTDIVAYKTQFAERIISELPDLTNITVWQTHITEKIHVVKDLSAVLDSTAIENYADFEAYCVEYNKRIVVKADMQAWTASNNETLGSSFELASETAPQGITAEVLKVKTTASGYPSLPFLYSNGLAWEDYSWTNPPLADNSYNELYGAYVSLWVKAIDAPVSIDVFTMNNAWQFRNQVITITPQDGWVKIVVKLNGDNRVESSTTGYGYLAGIRTVEVDENGELVVTNSSNSPKFKAGSFLMTDLRLWLYDPTQQIETERNDASNQNIARVISLINALPNQITATQVNDVVEARKAYNALLETEQALITNYQTLVLAEAQFVNVFDELVAALPNINDVSCVTQTLMGKVEQAETVYAALTETQKLEKEDSYNTLVALKEHLESLPYALLDMSNEIDRATFSTDRFKGTDVLTTTMSATLATEQDATYGEVLSLTDIAVSGTYSRVNFRNGDQDGAKWKERIKGYDCIVFYVYSSASCSLRYDRGDWSSMYEIDSSQFTSDQAKKTAITGGQWNKIVLTYGQFYSMVHYNDGDFGGVYFYFTTDLTGGSLKFSNFYGVSEDSVDDIDANFVNSLQAKIDALKDTSTNEEWDATLNAYMVASKEVKAQLTNTAKLAEKITLKKVDLTTLNASKNSTIGGVYTASNESAPTGVAATEVIDVNFTGDEGFQSMPFLYSNDKAQADYDWASNPLLDNGTTGTYYHTYVSFYVKADKETTIQVFTMNDGWERRKYNTTVTAEDGWVQVIVGLNDGESLGDTTTGYSYLAGIRVVDADGKVAAGAFSICELTFWSANPSTLI